MVCLLVLVFMPPGVICPVYTLPYVILHLCIMASAYLLLITEKQKKKNKHSNTYHRTLHRRQTHALRRMGLPGLRRM